MVVIITPVILVDVEEDETVSDAEDVVQPEEVEGLQAGEQRHGDVVGNPALVLLRLPVELVRPNRLELVESGPEDAEVEIVAQVEPDEDEECEIRSHQGVIQVVEDFGCLVFLSRVWTLVEGEPTARKKSLMSCVIYTGKPIHVK